MPAAPHLDLHPRYGDRGIDDPNAHNQSDIQGPINLQAQPPGGPVNDDSPDRLALTVGIRDEHADRIASPPVGSPLLKIGSLG